MRWRRRRRSMNNWVTTIQLSVGDVSAFYE